MEPLYNSARLYDRNDPRLLRPHLGRIGRTSRGQVSTDLIYLGYWRFLYSSVYKIYVTDIQVLPIQPRVTHPIFDRQSPESSQKAKSGSSSFRTLNDQSHGHTAPSGWEVRGRHPPHKLTRLSWRGVPISSHAYFKFIWVEVIFEFLIVISILLFASFSPMCLNGGSAFEFRGFREGRGSVQFCMLYRGLGIPIKVKENFNFLNSNILYYCISPWRPRHGISFRINFQWNRMNILFCRILSIAIACTMIWSRRRIVQIETHGRKCILYGCLRTRNVGKNFKFISNHKSWNHKNHKNSHGCLNVHVVSYWAFAVIFVLLSGGLEKRQIGSVPYTANTSCRRDDTLRPLPPRLPR